MLPSLLCAATTLLVAASPFVSAQPRPRGALPDAIDSIVQSYLKDGRAAGMSIAVIKGTDTIVLKGYTELRGFGAMASRDLPKDSLLALFDNEKFDFLPGDAQVYNNSAYFLLGLIVEKASGMSYADFVQKRIFDKVGMPDSRYCSERTLTPHKTHGYEMGPTGLVNKGYIVHTYPYSAGSLCSTAVDVAAWVPSSASANATYTAS